MQNQLNFQLPISSLAHKPTGLMTVRLPVMKANIQRLLPDDDPLQAKKNRLLHRKSCPYKQSISSLTSKRSMASLKNNENENTSNRLDTNPRSIHSKFNACLAKRKKSLNDTLNTPTVPAKKVAVKYPSLPRIDRNIISIKIQSNWGNTNKIALFLMSLIDENKHQIKPTPNRDQLTNDSSNNIYISSIPEPESLSTLEYLLDSSYVKDDDRVFINSYLNNDFTIFLSVKKSINISSISIFNPKVRTPAAVKSLTIFINNTFSQNVKLPQTFGLNLKVSIGGSVEKEENENLDLKSDYQIPKTIAHTDKFGILPIRPIKQLKIEIIETHLNIVTGSNRFIKPTDILNYIDDNNFDYFGINGFDIYDIYGKLIETHSSQLVTQLDDTTNSQNKQYKIFEDNDEDRNVIQDITITGLLQLVNYGVLLRHQKVTINEEEMFVGIMDRKQKPTFIITFREPICVSQIVIWNYNGKGKKLKCGVKKAKVYTDDALMWYGPVPCGVGDVNNYPKTARVVPLTDHIPFIRKIEY